MTKKLITTASAVIMATLIFSGCGNGSGSSPSKSASGTSAPATSTPAVSTAPSPDNGGSSQGSGQTKEIIVTAKNFEFDKKEIHVKKGDKVKLTLKNAQGAHGLEIPDYNVNLKHEGTTEFVADKAGTFDYNCSVMCGTGHDNMTGKLIVEE
jgi:cytochrome c oxidase subunit 2